MTNILEMNNFYIGAATSSASSALNAFDRAMLGAGCGNYNLLRVSSILPPFADETPIIALAEGSLLPIAYAELIVEPDEKADIILSAAVAVAIPDDRSKPGVIMEYSDRCNEEITVKRVRQMAICAMNDRKIQNYKIITKSSSCAHKEGYFSCAFACVALF